MSGRHKRKLLHPSHMTLPGMISQDIPEVTRCISFPGQGSVLFTFENDHFSSLLSHYLRYSHTVRTIQYWHSIIDSNNIWTWNKGTFEVSKKKHVGCVITNGRGEFPNEPCELCGKINVEKSRSTSWNSSSWS